MNTDLRIPVPVEVAKSQFLYWIKERLLIQSLKAAGEPKPWSRDSVFQTTYFCNVHREDDKVTKELRWFYAPYASHELFEYNTILSRFINWPPTILKIGYQKDHTPFLLKKELAEWAEQGKIWGGAYVITTHGMKMDKLTYLCHHVLEDVYTALPAITAACRGLTLARAARALEQIDGIGTFLAGQVVADLKNTDGHPLAKASDWWTFVTPGPGSLRGLGWFHTGQPDGVTPSLFENLFGGVRRYVDENLEGIMLCNQDLQNCLCEYDKYMRVSTGFGRSKRKYNGV